MRSATFSAALLAVVGAALPAQDGRRSDMDRWDHVKRSYDQDGDGRVTADEYPRGERAFSNLDRNKDGVVSEDDFGRRSREGRTRGAARGGRGGRSDRAEVATQFVDMYGSFINVDGKPGIGKDEWEQAVARLEPDADGVIARDAFSAWLGKAGEGRMARMGRSRNRRFDVDRDGSLTTGDLDAIFATLDTDSEGIAAKDLLPPGPGEPAPDFTLKFADDATRSVTLSSFEGGKPVALIFGSYT